MAKVLTAKAVEKLKAGPARREVPDGYVPGLYLIIQPSGRKSWAIRTRLHGRPIKVTLQALDLVKAREEARAAIEDARQGKDPRQAEADRKAARPLTFNELADQYLEKWARPRKRTAHEDARDIARDLRPIWGNRTAAEITRRDVVAVIDQKATTAPIRANRLHALLHKMFGWAVNKDLLPASPMTGLKRPSEERQRDRVLSDDEIRVLWQAFDATRWPWGPFLKLSLLTGQRRGELIGMRWSEVDLEKALWTLPAKSTKASRVHEVPLAAAAVEILRGMPRRAGSELVFPARGRPGKPVSGFSKATNDCQAKLAEATRRGDAAEVGKWRLHDLRRTAASGMARLGHPPHVVAAILNHSPGSTQGITSIYNRYRYSDEKRRALDAWASYVGDLTEGAASNVVPIRAGEV